MNPSSPSDRLIFHSFLSLLPTFTKERIQVIQTLFHDGNGIVLGITTLRDLILERPPLATVCIEFY